VERSEWTDKSAVSIHLDYGDRMAQLTLRVSGEAALERAADGEMLPSRQFDALEAAEDAWRVITQVLALMNPEVD
jgi:hypothetical protein